MSCKRVAGAEAIDAGGINWPQAGRNGAAAGEAQGPREQHNEGPDLPQLLEQARAKGMAAGEARADEKWRARLEAEQGKAARLVGETIRWKARLRREAEQEMLALALAVARRIVRREVQLDPGVLAGILKSALDRCDEREEIRVRVAAGETAVLAQHFEKAGLAVRFRLEADPAAEPGSLWIETGAGALDASPESQLAEIERGLADRLAALRNGETNR